METTTNQNNSDSSIAQSDEKIKASEQKAEIVYIPIEKLHPHDKNPRQNVGDVSELAESIKKNGVLQNLTVVPATGYWHGDYIVIIGHRRLAAAKQAGINVLPCIIREMTPKEQVATMLVENINRHDLTIYEQAQGMQMMLDLGETVESVAEQTGFSKSTVRRRVRLTTLDEDTFKAAEGRQVTLADFDRLFEIEDPDKRNEVLKKIGTSNFEWSLNSAKNAEQTAKKRAAVIEKIAEFALPIQDTSEKKYVKAFYSTSTENDFPKDVEDTQYYYKEGTYSIDLYRDYTEDELEQRTLEHEKEEREENTKEKEAERGKRLEELAERAYELRYNFIKNFSGAAKKSREITILAVNTFVNDWYDNEIDIDKMADLLGITIPEDWSDDDEDNVFEYFAETTYKSPEQVLLAVVYCNIGDSQTNRYFDWQFNYQSNKELDALYESLIALGYEISDEEKALRDGTHELYKPSEEDAELNDGVDETDDIDVDEEQEPDAE